MLGNFFECESDKNKKYYRVIHTVKEYSDGRRFPIDEIIQSIEEIKYNESQFNSILKIFKDI